MYCTIYLTDICHTGIHSFSTGTTDFLTTNPGFLNDDSLENELLCNKDTGGLKSLQCWSRGMFFVVSGGGHIEYWQPLYRYVSSKHDFNNIQHKLLIEHGEMLCMLY